MENILSTILDDKEIEENIKENPLNTEDMLSNIINEKMIEEYFKEIKKNNYEPRYFTKKSWKKYLNDIPRRRDMMENIECFNEFYNKVIIDFISWYAKMIFNCESWKKNHNENHSFNNFKWLVMDNDTLYEGIINEKEKEYVIKIKDTFKINYESI